MTGPAERGVKHQLNIRQVASLAGVSHMTVSRVLNGHPNIRPETRDRVLEVIEAVKYRPSRAARELATRRSNRIGVLVDSAVEFGPNSTLHAVEQAAREFGYSVSAVTLADRTAVSPHDAIEHLTGQGVDALCVIAPRRSSVDVLREITDGMPVLVVKPESDATFLTASVDQRGGAELAVDHLLGLGHRDVLHVAGPFDWLDAQVRESAWRGRMVAAGFEPRPVVMGDWTSDFGYQFGRQFDELPPFTAIFAANDQLALGLIHGFHERGIRVPHDVSIVGFDDLPDARHFLPPLTTVRQDFGALGTLAIEKLHAALSGASIPRRARIAPQLVVRESTAAPRQ